jgi:hypothetical protein
MKKLVYTTLLVFGLLIPLLSFPQVLAGPTTITFNSEAALDGYIAKWGRPYPPTQHVDVSPSYSTMLLGQWRDRDTTEPGYLYCIERGFISFDTSSIPDNAPITNARLRLKTQFDASDTDFNMKIWGGQQPLYGATFEANDWNASCTADLGTWNTASYPGSNAYIEFGIPAGQINRAGRTQFMLRTDREGTSPTGDEYISLWSGNSPGNEPVLEITYDRAEWTFMVYLDADNNLEGAGIGDFQEMAQVGSSAHINIVVQMDRAAGFDTSNGDWTDCRRFYITNGLTPAANPLQNLGEINMGNPNELVNFVQWGVEQYPADNYLVVLWDHGMGCVGLPSQSIIGGVCYDDASNGDCITMAELRQAMLTIRGSLGRNLNIIGFDACLMEMVEVAYQVRDTADIMVGSEEYIPWFGWPYEDILTHLAANPAMSAAALSTNIVQDYINSYHGGGHMTDNSATLSAFYVNQLVANVAPAVSTFADRLIDNLASYRSQIVDGIANTEFYDIVDYRDLHDFANEVRTRVPVVAVQSAAQSVMDTLVAARIAEGHGTNHPQSQGLSIYLTDNADGAYSNLDFAANTHWDEFLANLHTRCPAIFSLTISMYDGDSGTTQPSAGTHTYYGSDKVTMTAYPSTGHYFTFWRIDGAYYYSNPVSVFINYRNHAVVCYMYHYGGGGCPTLFVWNGSDYECEGLLDIHNPEGIDVHTEHTLVAKPHPFQGTYLLNLVEHPQTISHIDQVKLYAVLQNGKAIRLPLVWAYHSQEGNVLPQLLFSDDQRTDTKGADHNDGTNQNIQLRFLALPHYLAVASLVFHIEGNNMYYKV